MTSELSEYLRNCADAYNLHGFYPRVGPVPVLIDARGRDDLLADPPAPTQAEADAIGIQLFKLAIQRESDAELQQWHRFIRALVEYHGAVPRIDDLGWMYSCGMKRPSRGGGGGGGAAEKSAIDAPDGRGVPYDEAVACKAAAAADAIPVAAAAAATGPASWGKRKRVTPDPDASTARVRKRTNVKDYIAEVVHDGSDSEKSEKKKKARERRDRRGSGVTKAKHDVATELEDDPIDVSLSPPPRVPAPAAAAAVESIPLHQPSSSLQAPAAAAAEPETIPPLSYVPPEDRTHYDTKHTKQSCTPDGKGTATPVAAAAPVVTTVTTTAVASASAPAPVPVVASAAAAAGAVAAAAPVAAAAAAAGAAAAPEPLLLFDVSKREAQLRNDIVVLACQYRNSRKQLRVITDPVQLRSAQSVSRSLSNELARAVDEFQACLRNAYLNVCVENA